MGQSKNGGYTKLSTGTSGQNRAIENFIKQAGPLFQQSAEGYKQYIPGGQGNQAIANQANQNFKQQTLPSILNAYGSGAKSSSALNQALAGGAANLNTNLAAINSGAGLQAAQGLGNLGSSAGQLGSQNQFAYQQTQQPFWQSALLASLNGGSQIAGGQAQAGAKIFGLL